MPGPWEELLLIFYVCRADRTAAFIIQYINDYFTAHLRTAKRNPSETFQHLFYKDAVSITEDKRLQKSRKWSAYSLHTARSRYEVTWGFHLGSCRENWRETLVYLSVVSMMADEYGFGAILL